MSVHVLLNLSNKLRKRDKMRGLPSILSLSATSLINSIQFNKDSIYRRTLKLLKNRIFGVKTSRYCHLLHNIIMDVISYVTKSVNH